MLGLVCNVRNALPGRAELVALKPTAVRSIIYSVADVGKLLAVLPYGVYLDLMVNNECQEVGYDWSGLEDALTMIARNYAGRVRLVEVGNELDRYWATNPSDVPPSFGANLIRRALPILQPAGIKTIMASVAGPKWQEWLEQAIAACAVLPDGVAMHPYGQRPDGWGQAGWGFGDLRPAIIRAYGLAKLPVYVTEFGVKVNDAGGEQGQAEYLTAAAATLDALGAAVCPVADLFCWRDDVGAPDERGENGFGLRQVDGSMRPSWSAFQSVNAVAPPVPDPTPDPEPVLAAEDASLLDLWQAIRSDVDYAPATAIGRLWASDPYRFGPPLGKEHEDRDAQGVVVQVLQTFGSARLRWRNGQADAEVA